MTITVSKIMSFSTPTISKLHLSFSAFDNRPSMELDLSDINEGISFIPTIRNHGRGDYLIGNQVDNESISEDEKGCLFI